MTDLADLERRDPLQVRPLKEIPLGELEREFSHLLSRLVGSRYVASVLRLHLEPDADSHALEIDFRVRPDLRAEGRGDGRAPS